MVHKPNIRHNQVFLLIKHFCSHIIYALQTKQVLVYFLWCLVCYDQVPGSLQLHSSLVQGQGQVPGCTQSLSQSPPEMTSGSSCGNQHNQAIRWFIWYFRILQAVIFESLLLKSRALPPLALPLTMFCQIDGYSKVHIIPVHLPFFLSNIVSPN